MPRTKLPHRRPNLTVQAEWGPHPIAVTVGLDLATAKPAEVFADTLKGGQMQATVADACVLISIALQHGISIDELGKSLAREPDVMQGGDATIAASPIGVIVEQIAQAAGAVQASLRDAGAIS